MAIAENETGGAGALGGGAGYRVLARKYRPADFRTLIGQDAMVRTLRNSFAAGRIPQAWMLSGVRGVGKTTTARILARALNYEPADGPRGGPNVDLPTMGRHCAAIIEGRHIDVLELDAASHTGVDNVRQINDSLRYAPAEARYKVLIIDEVHMLSTSAFNAFLKTLEEPPPHAKFVFATTEIRKVPVTILSRCQRFDLKRVGADLLLTHLAGICTSENVGFEEEALAILARVAEGSVRDSLSLLDQAIAHGGGRVAADSVRAMLGLVDRGRIIDLFGATMAGRVAEALDVLGEIYGNGGDPAGILADLAEFTHIVTRLKVAPEPGRDSPLTEVERRRGAEFAGTLGLRVLSRTWQMLLKAIPEVQAAPRPIAAAEMALVRIAHSADLPTPDDTLRQLLASTDSPGGDGGRPVSPPASGAPPRPRLALAAGAAGVAAAPDRERAPAPPVPRASGPALAGLADLVKLARTHRDLRLADAIERDVQLVRFEEGHIEFALAAGGARSLASDIAQRLQAWTGRRWIVAINAQAPAAATLREKAETEKRQEEQRIAENPLVAAILARFPGATIAAVRRNLLDEPTPGDAPAAVIDDDSNPAAPIDELAFAGEEPYIEADSHKDDDTD